MKEQQELDNKLIIAAQNGNVREIRNLLAQGAYVDTYDVRYNTPLLWAAYSGHGEAVRLLLAKNANINSEDINFNTPLIEASRRGHVEVVKILVEAGADVSAQGQHGTAYQTAQKHGKVHVVAYFDQLDLEGIAGDYQNEQDLMIL